MNISMSESDKPSVIESDKLPVIESDKPPNPETATEAVPTFNDNIILPLLDIDEICPPPSNEIRQPSVSDSLRALRSLDEDFIDIPRLSLPGEFVSTRPDSVKLTELVLITETVNMNSETIISMIETQNERGDEIENLLRKLITTKSATPANAVLIAAASAETLLSQNSRKLDDNSRAIDDISRKFDEILRISELNEKLITSLLTQNAEMRREITALNHTLHTVEQLAWNHDEVIKKIAQ
jgi:hypothetical protein